MTVIKGMRKVLGARFTKEEQEAASIEIARQLAEASKSNEVEIDACMLWFLHTELHFGKKRLRWAHTKIRQSIEDLCNRYDLHGPTDGAWLCTRMLLDYGVDVKAWNEEQDREMGGN